MPQLLVAIVAGPSISLTYSLFLHSGTRPTTEEGLTLLPVVVRWLWLLLLLWQVNGERAALYLCHHAVFD